MSSDIILSRLSLFLDDLSQSSGRVTDLLNVKGEGVTSCLLCLLFYPSLTLIFFFPCGY